MKLFDNNAIYIDSNVNFIIFMDTFNHMISSSEKLAISK